MGTHWRVWSRGEAWSALRFIESSPWLLREGKNGSREARQRIFPQDSKMAVAQLGVVVEWREGADSAQILRIEPIGFPDMMALGWKDRRQIQGFCSE